MLALVPAILIATAFAQAGAAGAAGPVKLTARTSATTESPSFKSDLARCEAGGGFACFATALYLPAPQGDDNDVRNEPSLRDRVTLLQRGCDLGDHQSCIALARHLALGAGVSRDEDRARKLARDACDIPRDKWQTVGDGYWRVVGAGCVVLSQLTNDPERVREYLQRACTVGYRGIKGEIYTNEWMPGYPRYGSVCGNPRLGRLVKKSVPVPSMVATKGPLPSKPDLACKDQTDCAFTHFDEECCWRCGARVGGKIWVKEVDAHCEAHPAKLCPVPSCGQVHVELSCTNGRCARR